MQQHWDEKSPPGRAEINLHAMTAGVAMLSLFCWLMKLRYLASLKEASALPARLAIITDKGKGSKEQGNLVVKEAVAAIMALWQAPFRYCSDHSRHIIAGILHSEREHTLGFTNYEGTQVVGYRT